LASQQIGINLLVCRNPAFNFPGFVYRGITAQQ
jgi:hypothetical protein